MKLICKLCKEQIKSGTLSEHWVRKHGWRSFELGLFEPSYDKKPKLHRKGVWL